MHCLQAKSRAAGWALSPGLSLGLQTANLKGRISTHFLWFKNTFFFLISSPGGKPQNLFCHVIPYLGLSFRNVTAEDWKLNCAGDVRDAAKRGFQRKPATRVSLLQQSLVSSL